MNGTRNISAIFFMNSHSLKKELFYFDKLIISKENLKRAQIIGELFSKVCDSTGNLFRKNIQEIERLEKVGFLEFYKPIQVDSCDECLKIQENIDFKRIISRIAQLEIDLMDVFGHLIKDNSKFHERFISTLKISIELSDLQSILTSIILNHKDEETTPIVELYKSLNIIENQKTNAINVTINRFPQIDSSLSIEELSDFKSDTEINYKLKELKCAIVDISQNNYTITETEEKIDCLLHEYEELLKLHNRKIYYNNLDILISSTFGIFESILKFDLINAGKKILSLKKEKIDLLLERKNLKGSELAYITNLSEHFDKYKIKNL